MPLGEDNLGDHAREQLEAARRDPRLDRGNGAMVVDYQAAIEEVERTRMMSILGLHEIRRGFERERKNGQGASTDLKLESRLQTYWERAELARAEIEQGHPSINAQALIGLNSALDALVEQFTPAILELPFQGLIKRAEEEVPEAAQQLSDEVRGHLLTVLKEMFKAPRKLKRMGGSGVARYEARLEQVGLAAPEDRPILR